MSSSYWCYRCSRFVRVWRQDVVICPDCDSGFVEQIEHPSRSVHVEARRRRFPAAAMYMIGPRPTTDQNSRPPVAPRRSRRNGGDRSPFNPVIVLRGSPDRSGQVSGKNESKVSEGSAQTRSGILRFACDEHVGGYNQCL